MTLLSGNSKLVTQSIFNDYDDHDSLATCDSAMYVISEMMLRPFRRQSFAPFFSYFIPIYIRFLYLLLLKAPFPFFKICSSKSGSLLLVICVN
jgi:hypothetical protein